MIAAAPTTGAQDLARLLHGAGRFAMPTAAPTPLTDVLRAAGLCTLGSDPPPEAVDAAVRQLVALLDGAAPARCQTAAAAAVRLLTEAGVEHADQRVAGAFETLQHDAEADETSQQDSEAEESRPTQAQILCRLAFAAKLTFWHTPDDVGYATVPANGHVEHWPIRSRSFRRYLTRLFFEQMEKPPGSQAVQDALHLLEAKAQFDGERHHVYLRLGEHDGKIYLDLGDESWRAVEITADGWKIVENPPVRFRRSRAMAALPIPEAGGSIEDLRPFVNIEDDADWRLLVACLVAMLRPRGPYAIPALHGEQGSAKSTLCRIIRALIDPSTAELRSLPRDERDLMIAAHNAWLLPFDNLSHIPDRVSDAVCRLVTGAGFTTRQLYSDDEEVIFEACRPVILNGITDYTTRDDLRDREVILTLAPIPEAKRKDEESFWRDFEAVRPKVLGALLNAVSGALMAWSHTRLDSSPRMADFARWATAAEAALGWETGSFLAAYTGNRAAAIELAVEHDAVASEVRALVSETGDWSGTNQDLLDVLNRRVPEDKRKSLTLAREWPKTSRGLSGKLGRCAPSLRALGVEVILPNASHREAGTGRRLLTIRKIPAPTVTTVTTATEEAKTRAASASAPVTVAERCDGSTVTDDPTVTPENPHGSYTVTVRDGCDGDPQLLSEEGNDGGDVPAAVPSGSSAAPEREVREL